MLETNILQNLANIRAEIESASKAAGRKTSDVNLLAVSKTKPIEQIRAAITANQSHFGENYLQEAILKIEQLAQLESGPIWHFIGHIQSNKTRLIAENFDWVHTIDSLKIAQRLNNQRPPEKGKLNVFLQVNIDAQETKSGFSPSALSEAIAAICQLPMLNIKGLMTIPAVHKNILEQRKPFQQLALLQQRMKQEHQLENFTDLSMGMSADLTAAITEGSTWVRIGSRLFGQRN